VWKKGPILLVVNEAKVIGSERFPEVRILKTPARNELLVNWRFDYGSGGGKSLEKISGGCPHV